jgi:hypothetical protein
MPIATALEFGKERTNSITTKTTQFNIRAACKTALGEVIFWLWTSRSAGCFDSPNAKFLAKFGGVASRPFERSL